MSHKNLYYLIKNKNHSNLDDEIINKERYHRNSNKILITERKNDNNDNYYKNYLMNRIDNSFNIAKKLSYLKIKKTSTGISPNTKFIEFIVTKNLPKKQIFQKMNISKINNPVRVNRSNKLLQNKNNLSKLKWVNYK